MENGVDSTDLPTIIVTKSGNASIKPDVLSSSEWSSLSLLHYDHHHHHYHYDHHDHHHYCNKKWEGLHQPGRAVFIGMIIIVINIKFQDFNI